MDSWALDDLDGLITAADYTVRVFSIKPGIAETTGEWCGTAHSARNRSERLTEFAKPCSRCTHAQCSSIVPDTNKSVELHRGQHRLVLPVGGRGEPSAVGRSEVEEVIDGRQCRVGPRYRTGKSSVGISITRPDLGCEWWGVATRARGDGESRGSSWRSRR